MKLNKKFLAIMLAMGCISAMGAISVSAESEENQSTIIEEPDDGSDDTGDIDLGNDDIFGEPEDNNSNSVTDDTNNNNNNTNNIPVIDNVTPTPTTPTTNPLPSTPQTGDVGVILSAVTAALSAGGIAVSKRISK